MTGVKHNQMKPKTADTPSTRDVAPPGTSARQSRRRFVREVGVIAPLILTVGSRSALARSCLSPSASASISLLNSRPDRLADGVCNGRTPGYWRNDSNFRLADTTQFNSIFPGGFALSMRKVTALGGNGNFEALARHLAAAWCNRASGLVSPTILDFDDLVRMWAGRTGSYTPIPGGSVMWGEAQIVDYLTSTMI